MARVKLVGWWQLLTNSRCKLIILKEAWFVFKWQYLPDICQKIIDWLHIFFWKFQMIKAILFFFFHNDLNIFESKGFGLSFEQHETLSYFLTVFLYPCKLIPQFSLAHQTNRNTTGGIWPWWIGTGKLKNQSSEQISKHCLEQS